MKKQFKLTFHHTLKQIILDASKEAFELGLDCNWKVIRSGKVTNAEKKVLDN